jgi:YHS domain-containing protein
MEELGGEELEAVVVDPVCETPVIAGAPGTLSLQHGGHTWRFCSEACRGHFVRQLQRAILADALAAGRLLSPRERQRWSVA